MLWKKLGMVFNADNLFEWASSHAYLPTPFQLNPDTLRIYCSFLDKNGVGRIGYVDVDAENPLKVKHVSKEPVLDIGSRGMFDDNGVAPSSIIEYDGSLYLLYVGFQLHTKIRYTIFTGIAVSEDHGDTFQRLSVTPFLERTQLEPFFRTAPHIIRDDGIFRMWYVGGGGWISLNQKEVPVYDIKCLTLSSPTTLSSRPTTVLPISDNEVHGYGRPFVLRRDDRYEMFYSIRYKKQGYRLGLAVSEDGLLWDRIDEQIGINVSSDGWDSNSVEFSAVIKSGDRTFMFYNGNGFGSTGFGAAELIDD